ncbi:MAG: AAA family ATPase [Kangiellaceae bacterium]|nr:AAA family ATPase [Kangiellaceae bacterium]
MSQRHKEALTHLVYGINQGAGFVLLTGEVGTGKTTICRQVLRTLPESTQLAFILNPMLNAQELLASLCDELAIDYDENNYSLKQLTDKLTQHLLACYKDNINVVLMIDEAQNLAPQVLEQIRLLTNLETDNKKLLQIILVGQPELQQLLARKDLRQLAQRVTARYHLQPLNQDETFAYIQHRLRVAGAARELFKKSAIRSVFTSTGGVPRLINNLCDRALMDSYSREQNVVNQASVKRASDESLPPQTKPEWYQFITWPKSLVLAAVAIALVITGVVIAPIFSQSIISEHSSVKDQSTQARSNGSLKNYSQSVQARSRNDIFRSVIGESVVANSETIAMKVIAMRWLRENYALLDKGPVCQQLAATQLECYRAQGDWQQLVRYNRPSIVQVTDHKQAPQWVALLAVAGSQVQLQSVKGQQWLSLEDFWTIWTGSYQFIWQKPPSYQRPLKIGDQGNAVVWLAQRLDFLMNQSAQVSDTFSSQFDNNLYQRVILFQNINQLDADGLVGMSTLMTINELTIDGLPKLSEAQ